MTYLDLKVLLKKAGEEWQKPKLALLSVVALLVAAEATAEAKICQCGPTSTRLQCLNFFWAVTAPAILPQLFWIEVVFRTEEIQSHQSCNRRSC